MAQEVKAVSSSEKPWYKKGWVILIIPVVFISLPFLFLFSPIIALALIWTRKKWGRNAKIGASVAVVAAVVLFLAALPPSTSTDNGKNNQISTDQPKLVNEAAPVPAQKPEIKLVFDVPSLLGKSINEIKTILGPVENDTEPTQVQIGAGITEWDKSWEREDADLLVTYNVKTKQAVDFFVSGVDSTGVTGNKELLLTVSGIKLGQPEYDVEFVQVINTPNQYTGVKITPVDMKARAALIEKRSNFDTDHGSDAFASEQALSTIKTAKDSGLEMDVFIKAEVPSDVMDSYLKGGNESDIRSKTKSATLNAVVNNAMWAYTPDSTKKDLVTSLMTRLRQIYPNAVPRVYVSNGIRTVAEGSFSVWSGDKVELK